MNCSTNVVHVRAFDSYLFRVLDALSLRVAALAGLGPWRCVDCGQKGMFLRSRRDLQRRNPARNANETQSVGNFIHNELGLVNSKTRAERFSPKFRRAIVDRVLNGQSSISQIGQEIGVSEIDIQLWIKESFDQLAQHHQAALNKMTTANLEEPSSNDPAPARKPDLGDGVVLDSAVLERRAR